MNEIIKLVVVLGIICAVSGFALAGVYSVTKGPIELQQLTFVQGPAVAAVLADKDNDPIKDNFKIPAGKDKKGRDAFQTIFPAKKGGKLAALALENSGKGYGGDVGVMVGINPENDSLTGIAITKQAETPGIGSKVTLPAFTDQFKGASADSPTAVDGVSGATISTKAVFMAVENAVKFYKDNKKDILAQAGR